MADDRAIAPLHVHSRNGARIRDRRMAFAGLLATLSRGLERTREPLALRRILEDGLRRVLPVRDITLRDHQVRLSVVSAGANRTPESRSEERRVGKECRL